MPANPPPIQTARLLLTGHGAESFGPLAAMWADPHAIRHIGGTPSTPEQSWARLLRYRGLWPILGYGYWCIRERHTGRFVGDVGFADFHRSTQPPISGAPEAGWVLAPWSHGQGYASEAVAAVLAWLDATIRPDRVVCLIDRANLASLRIAEKNRFQPAGDVEMNGATIPLFSRMRAQ